MTAENVIPGLTPDARVLGRDVISTHEAVLEGRIGEAVIVVHYDSQLNGDNAASPIIATGRVVQGKDSSGKGVGQNDIFIETRKVGEDPAINRWGALAEFCNDVTIADIQKHLYYVEGGLGETTIDGKKVGMSVMLYDGPKELDFHPSCGEEVEFNGWIGVSEFLRDDNTRSIARQFVRDAIRGGLLQRAIHNFSDSDLRTRVFPPGFSIEAFHREREKLEDIKFDLPSAS